MYTYIIQSYIRHRVQFFSPILRCKPKTTLRLFNLPSQHLFPISPSVVLSSEIPAVVCGSALKADVQASSHSSAVSNLAGSKSSNWCYGRHPKAWPNCGWRLLRRLLRSMVTVLLIGLEQGFSWIHFLWNNWLGWKKLIRTKEHKQQRYTNVKVKTREVLRWGDKVMLLCCLVASNNLSNCICHLS